MGGQSMKITNILLDIVYFTWCLPQTLVGLVIKLIETKNIKKVETYKLNTQVNWIDWDYGVSLGKYILVGTYDEDTGVNEFDAKNHEFGHVRQNFMLGPLYLILVGLPSITFNIISQYNDEFGSHYYQRYPENWADWLGGVKR
jgi:hypothetical protein